MRGRVPARSAQRRYLREVARAERSVLVLGAGASGLAAASALASEGVRVVVVEARPRTGGRVDTRHDARFGTPVEHGAEFVHGRPAVVQALAKRARARLLEIDGQVLTFRGRTLVPALRQFERMHELLEAGGGEGPFSDVLEGNEARRFSPLERGLARGFVEGYYLAPAKRQGRAALRAMTEAEERIGAERSFRVREGQAALLAPLVHDVTREAELRLSTTVTQVRWRPGRVAVEAKNAAGARLVLQAERLVVTLPAPLLAAGEPRFTPALTEKRRTAQRLDAGPVVKVHLRFRRAVWRERGAVARPFPELAFAIAPTLAVPTWWTPFPLDAPLLVGWAGGPSAARLDALSDREVVHRGLATLARAFRAARPLLEDALDDATVTRWARDPLARGGYAVFPPGTSHVPAELAAPLDGTLFFAGEATTLGAAGTVHGALESGARAAREVLASL